MNMLLYDYGSKYIAVFFKNPCNLYLNGLFVLDDSIKQLLDCIKKVYKRNEDIIM